MSSSSSDSDDEGFAPFIPGLTTTTTAAPQPTPSCKVVESDKGHTAGASVEPSPGTKRARESSVEAHTPPTSSPCAPEHNSHTETCQAVASAITAAEEQRAAAWERYVRLGLPSASLYYRSFQHTSEPTPLPAHVEDANADANAGHSSDTNTEEEKKEGQTRDAKRHATAEDPTPGSPKPYLVDDMLTIQDSLGLLVCSIDERGVLRLWRKLPRGIFFWGELDRIFGTSTATAAAHGEREGDDDDAHAPAAECRYYLRSSADLSSLVCVRVQTLRDSPLTEQPARTDSAAATRTAVVDVLVEVRLVNPYMLTVEGRHAYAFAAPLHDGQPCYTPQPSLLVHKYEMYLVFFTALVPSSTEASASSAHDAAAPTLAQGVVVVRCQADKSTMRSPHESSALASPLSSAVQYVLAAPLSVASRVVACAHPGAASRAHQEQHKAPLPCVLLGADGMIDYAVMESTPINDSDDAEDSARVPMRRSGSLHRRNGLGLRVVGGLATCPPRSAEHRLWSQMISFKRRANTDFFALLKLARASTDASVSAQATPGLNATHGAALKAVVMPLACSFVPNGTEFVIASVCVSLRSRSPTTNTAATELAVSVQNCLHWVDFASGKLRGSYVAPLDGTDGVEVIPMRLPSTTQLSDVMDAWGAFANTLMMCGRAGAGCCPMVGMHVLPSACPAAPGGFEYHVLVPEISPAELLPGLVASSRTTHSGSDVPSGQQAGVPGRLVRVYRAALAETNTSSATPALSLTIEPLSHAVGESERVVRRRALPTPTHHAASTSSGDYTALLLAATSDAGVTRRAHPSMAHSHFPTTPRGSAMVPLLLLASNVAPSQSLKNFISQSPVGASLSADEVKQLLVVPSRSEASRNTEAPTTYTDPLLCTTALGPSAASALLLFSATPAEANPTTAAAAQWLEKILTTPHDTQEEAETATAQGTASGDAHCNGTPSQAHTKTAVDLLVQQRVWHTLMQELAQRRQFACGDLLAGTTTVSHPAAPTPHADGAAGVEDAANDAHRLESGTGAEEAKGTTRSDVATPGSGAKAAPDAVFDEKSKVLALLAPVLATLPPPPPTASSPYVPKAHGLVHVRAYGTIRLAFLPDIAPLAVENFQRLARQGYYNALTFHRVIPLTIVQGGCPLGNGTGGRCVFPGQDTFADEILEEFPFFSHTEHAWLCMANAGRDTNGSQFFFTVPNGQEMPWLNGQHTVFGFVVGGASLLTAMSEVPRDEDDKPRIPIVMERIDIY